MPAAGREGEGDAARATADVEETPARERLVREEREKSGAQARNRRLQHQSVEGEPSALKYFASG